MPEIDLTPFLAEPIGVTIRDVRYVFPAELDIPDLLKAYDLNHKMSRGFTIYKVGEDGKPLDGQDGRKEEIDITASNEAERANIQETHDFLLEIAQRAGTTATELRFPTQMLGRLFGVLLVGSPEAENVEEILLEMITGKTAEERAAEPENGGPPTKPKAKRAGTRSRALSPVPSTS